MKIAIFEPNQPQTLTLEPATEPYKLPGSCGSLYTLTDGRLLHLAPSVGDSLALLRLQSGESFSICLHDQKAGELAFWSVWLSPATEKARAAAESTELEQTLQRSLELVEGGARPPLLAATGTDGPLLSLPQRKPAIAAVASGKRSPVQPIPLNVAFREILHFVCSELQKSGEQWTENSRQDLVSTLLIAAQKAHLLCVWERDAA